MKRAAVAGAVYFALVFAAGFLLGAIRTLWLVPRVGVRAAELLETPVMLGVSFVAARWTAARFRVPGALGARLAMGFLALALLAAAEIVLARLLGGLTLRAYVASRDPVSGSAYLLALLVYAALPALLSRRRTGGPG